MAEDQELFSTLAMDAITCIDDINKEGSNIFTFLTKSFDLEEFENESFTKNSKDLKDIEDLSSQYVIIFSPVSQNIEKWASHRRVLSKDVDSAIKSLMKDKLYVCRSKMIFSSLDVIGTTSSLILERFQKNWATTLLYTSAGFGCLSFISSMYDITKTSFCMEKILKELRTDTEYLEEIQDLVLKLNRFDRNVQKLFPHGIDLRVVKLIQEPSTARRNKPESYKNIIDALATTNEKVQIFLSIVISNGRADPSLLKDKEFLSKAKAFAKSSIAEKWWRRMKCNGMLPISQKTRLFTYLNSLSRMESMPIRTFPLLSSPVWHLNGFPAIGAIFMNSMVVFDSYCDLIQNCKTREIDILEELKQALQAEYGKIMHVYQQLTPYSDE